MSKKQVIVHGARCVWWDSIDKASKLPGAGIPCCPHCSGVLLETDEDCWWEQVNRHNGRAPGYKLFVEWLRGKCFRTFAEAQEAYKKRDDPTSPETSNT